MGRVRLRFNSTNSETARCENGHGWPDDESAPHPYVPPETPRPNRWTVYTSYGPSAGVPDPDRPGWRIFRCGESEPTGFTVRDAFGTSKESFDFSADERGTASAFAEEKNREEAQGPLDPAFLDRRNRLKEIAPDFGSFYYEGPPAARWPVRPGRYLVRDGGVGWHAEAFDELVETLSDVEAAIAADESSVYSVIDLDTGEEVPFEREVSVTLGAST